MIGLGSSLFLSVASLEAMGRTTVQTDNGSDAVETDVWYGSGYYYGLWFDDQDAYWRWRYEHRDYPSHRLYYHQSRPIYYHHHDSAAGHR